MVGAKRKVEGAIDVFSLSLSLSLLDCTLFIALTFSSVRVRVCIAKRVFKNKYNSISAL